MAVQAIPQQDNGAIALLSQIFQNSGSLFGSGETTSKETPDPNAMAQSQQLLQQILAGNNSGDIDNMISGILTKAKQAFGPNISNSLAQGNRALSDTTLATIQGQAQGTATAQAAEAKLNAIAKNNQIAAQIVNSQVANTTTKTTKTAASPTGNLLKMAGIAGAGYSAYKKATAAQTSGKKKPTDGLGQGVSGEDIFGAGTNVNSGSVDFAGDPSGGTLSANSQFTAEGGLDANSFLDITGTSAKDVFSLFGGGGEDITDFTTGGVLSAANDVSGGIDFLSQNDAITGGSNFIQSAAADNSGIFSGLEDVPLIGNYASGVDNLFSGNIGGAIGDFAQGAVGSLLGDVGGSVICTELYRQGKFPEDIYANHLLVAGRCIKLNTINGYHFWAKPFVKLMQRSKLITTFIRPFAIAWSGQLCYDAHLVDIGHSSLFGKIIRKIGEPVCTILGKMFVSTKIIPNVPKVNHGLSRS